ncbi:ketoacyl-ACP synthase III [Pseudomonas sp. GD03842]|uniref:ketoacyl-ACP synthase III n=1 Tax=Pseudomonas sp. GD03842 TaxID=2975385 RepID=UPI00244769C7|nr:ketoacyl-ACP synthase III [Pseudomonas sp. GD03842]MDH0749781.1 ketoacyl-ACP synthase III [Pseudomonas sp. GD03842]
MNSVTGSTDDAVRRISAARVRGIACALPDTLSEVADLTARFGEESVSKIMASTGIERRHVVTDQCTSDLCVEAAQRLLSDLNVDKASIDTLLFVTQTPDYVLPATACTLQRRLELPYTTAALDVNMGCSGYVYGLWMASAMVASGASKRVLLLVGDTISKLVAPDDRSVAALFGDAGSATLIDYDPSAPATPFVLGTDGRGEKNLRVPGGAFRDRSGLDTSTSEEGVRGPFDLYMDGAEIFAFTLARVPALVRALEACAVDQSVAIEKYVFHQANRFMLEHLAKKAKVPSEKVVLNLQQVGNTSSASIPLALSLDAQGAATTLQGHYLLAGFGVGYSWAGCVVDFNNTRISPLTRVAPSRNEA